MSAICGIYYMSGQGARGIDIAGTMEALAAFGPEGSDVWCAESVVLGHQHRHVTPESQCETLPRCDVGAGLAITADARLDNREELSATLGISPAERASLPDSEFILRAYQKWGLDCATELLGDFAFAIWDTHRHQLFCARDTFGVKPFFYNLSANRFCFASTLHAALPSLDVPREVDSVTLATYFRYAGNPPYSERTWYNAVRRLMPAHAITVRSNGIRTWAYWSPSQARTLRLPSDEAYIERLADLLHQAVGGRIRAAFPVGVHLSGGLDSSGIAVIAARQLRSGGASCTAFSWSPVPDGMSPNNDERALVEVVSREVGLPFQFTSATVYDVAARRLKPMDHANMMVVGLVQEHLVRQQAHAEGIRVLLSGWGGDEVVAFDGRGYLADLCRWGCWVRLWKECAKWAGLDDLSTWQVIKIKGILPLIPDRLLPLLAVSALAGCLPRQELPLPCVFHDDFAALLGQADPGCGRLLRERPGVRRLQMDLLAHGHLTNRIEAWATEAPEHPVVYRYPLLDRRLVDFGLSLPPELFFRNGWGRYILRRALEGIVPPQVQWQRTKQEPALNAARMNLESSWLTEVAGHVIGDVLGQYSVFHCLDVRRVREVLRSHLHDKVGRRSYFELYLGLRVEMMFNPELATDLQASLTSLCQAHLTRV